MPFSKKLADVLGGEAGILHGVSGNRAALRVGHSGGELANSTILELKKGIYGRADSIRTLARAYPDEILEKHRDEIEEVFGLEPGTADIYNAEDWLVFIATSEQIGSVRPPRPAAQDTQAHYAHSDGLERQWRSAMEVLLADAPFSEEFRVTLAELLPDATPESLNPLVPLGEDYWARILQGQIPPPTILNHLVDQMGWSQYERNRLLIAAGYREWDPEGAFWSGVAELAAQYGFKEIPFTLIFTEGVDELGPSQLRERLKEVGEIFQACVYDDRGREPMVGYRVDAEGRLLGRLDQMISSSDSPADVTSLADLVAAAFRRHAEWNADRVRSRWQRAIDHYFEGYRRYLTWCIREGFSPAEPAFGSGSYHWLENGPPRGVPESEFLAQLDGEIHELHFLSESQGRKRRVPLGQKVLPLFDDEHAEGALKAAPSNSGEAPAQSVTDITHSPGYRKYNWDLI